MTVSPRGRRAGATGALMLLALGGGCSRFHSGPMPGEPAGARFARVDGVRIRYRDSGGDRPAVLLIHGFASSLDTWDGVTRALAPRHRVVSLDLKGFGWTDRPAGDYSPAAQARLVRGLLDHLGVQQVAVVAHSWGVSVALELALQAPDRVRRLALYDAWTYPDQLPTFFLWARAPGLGEALMAMFYKERAEDRLEMAFYDADAIPQSLVDAVERALERPGTVAAALAAIRGQDFAALRRRLGGVRQPALLLWGREDRVTPLSIGERLAEDLPNARLQVYPRCGHLPMLEAAHRSTADLVAFLGEGT